MPAKKRAKPSAAPVPPLTGADQLLYLATQGHDAVTKAWFTKPENARMLFQHHLPTKIAAQIDFETLTLAPPSFIGTKSSCCNR